MMVGEAEILSIHYVAVGKVSWRQLVHTACGSRGVVGCIIDFLGQ